MTEKQLIHEKENIDLAQGILLDQVGEFEFSTSTTAAIYSDLMTKIQEYSDALEKEVFDET